MFPLVNIHPSAVPVRNTSAPIGNDTIDVMMKGCFGDFDTIACVRNGVMSMLAIMTMILCIIKICHLHINRHPTLHQYVIFYTATVEGLLLSLHWLLGMYAQLDFVAGYLKLVQFLVVSHFYWTLANRALRKESLTNRVIVPVYSVAFVYFTVIAVLGCIYVRNSWTECLQPYWLALSATEFAMVQLFVVAGFYITRRLNQISGLDCVRKAQKRDLWSVILAYEVSSLVAVTYDIILQIVGDEEKGCSGVFRHMQELYSPIFGTFMVVKFMLPLWAMLLVFQPLEVAPCTPELLPPRSEDGSFTSVFTPPDQASRYRVMHNPSTEGGGYQSCSPHTPTLGGAGVVGVSTGVGGALRRSASNTTNLTTICEDSEDVTNRGQNSEVTYDDRKPILS